MQKLRSDQPGKVCDGLWYLGRPESGVYWLQGSEGALIISGGTSYITADVIDQMQRFQLDGSELTGILILHAHFDHVGVVPYFKRRYPDLTVYASKRAWELLSNPKVVATINDFSRFLAERLGMVDAISELDLDWQMGMFGQTVSEGDVISLGDQQI
ncbi:MAG: MBL fold metallo-hydrolase, partial [Desulfomonilaceae bacterium]